MRSFGEANDSTSLFGSAPTLGSNFPLEFLARSHEVARLLEHEGNVEDGMRSLMGGMTEASHSEEMSEQPDAGIELEEEYRAKSPGTWVASSSHPDTRSLNMWSPQRSRRKQNVENDFGPTWI